MVAIVVLFGALALTPVRTLQEPTAPAPASTSGPATSKPSPIVIRFLDFGDLRSHQCSVNPSPDFPTCDDLAQAFCSEIGYTNSKVLGVGPMEPGDMQNIALYGMVC
jgi:hypothetical protein